MTIEDLMQQADTLYRYALSRVRDHHAAEDLVQDCLLAAWQRRDQFSGRSALSTWLIGILKFKVIDHYRQSQRTPTALKSESNGEEDDPMDILFDAHGSWKVDPNHGLEKLASAPGQAGVEHDIMTWIRACLTRLPERLRTLFTLREMEELDVASAAAAAGVTTGSAAVLLTRARQNMRLCLQRHGVQP
jgi:RNA polymerase sigma-70 factor (ECF subfamily)